LTRHHEERQAALEAPVLRDREDRARLALHIGQPHAEAVEAAEFYEFDGEFGDGSDLMNVDLPDDSALSLNAKLPS